MSAPTTGRAYLDTVLDLPGAVLAFAHRGGAEHPDVAGLENSQEAFAHAVAQGYRYLETDVHTTRDGVLVAFHDDELDRVTDRRGAIADLDWAEVSLARISGRAAVPTLADLIEAFPQARFNIDLKSDGAVAVLAAFIDRHQLHDRVLVGSFSPARLQRFRKLSRGRVPTSAHPGEVAVFLLSPSGRLARWLTGGRVAALQIPHRRRVRGVAVTVANRHLIRNAHAAGAHVHVWTIDDPDEMRVLLDRGVNGLITDRTDVLKAVLIERGVWQE